MGFFSDSQLQPLQPTLPQPGDPILLNRPRSLKAYTNKLGQVYEPILTSGRFVDTGGVLTPIDAGTVNPIIDLDARAVERGQQPMSEEQTIKALMAARPTDAEPFGRAINPTPERGSGLADIPANAVADVRDIFTSIPKIPMSLLKQVQDLPTAPAKLGEALGGDWAKLAEVPGVNLIPGVYTLSNLLSGQTKTLAQHPLMTALDVLPYAKAKVFSPSAAMLDEAGNFAPRASLYKQAFPSTRVTMREINQMVGRNTVTGETGRASIIDLAANTPLGQRIGTAKDLAKIRVRGGRGATEMYAGLGRETRNLMIQRNQITRLVGDLIDNPNSTFWASSENRRIFGNAFDADRPALEKIQGLEASYGDDFGKSHYKTIDAWKKRRQELGEIVQKRPEEIATLPEHERNFLRDYEDAANTVIEPYVSRDINTPRPFGEVEFTTPDGNVTREVVPFEQAQRIWATRERIAAHDEMSFLHRVVNDDEFRAGVDEQAILDSAVRSPILQSTTTSALTKSRLLEGYAHALTAKGVNARGFLGDVMRARYGPVPTPVIDDLAKTIQTRLPPGLDPPMVLDQLDEAVRPRYATTATRTGFRRQNIAEPLKELRGLLETRTTDYTLLKRRFNDVFDKVTDGRIDAADVPDSFRALDRDVVNQSIDLMRQRDHWSSNVDVKTMASTRAKNILTKQLGGLEARSAPARFYPKIEDMVNERMSAKAEELTARFMADDPAAGEALVRAVQGGNIGRLDPLIEAAGETKSAQQLYQGFATEARNSWKTLVDEGFDPKFVHHVPVGRGGKVHFASVNLSARKPGSWHARTLNIAPAEMDLSLALKSDAIDLLLKKGEDHMIDVITKGSPKEGWLPLARTKTQMLDALEPLIDAEAARYPGASRPAIAEKLLNRTHVAFDAEQYRNLPSSEGQMLYRSGAKAAPGKLTGPGATDQLYIPRSVHRAIEQLQAPPTARAIWDPVMGAFRTSTLILSPRWQVYNLLGNGMMGVMSGGFEFLKQFPKSIEILKRARRMEPTPEMSLGLRMSMAQGPKEQLEYAALSGEGIAKGLKSLGPERAEKVTNWGRPIGRGLSHATDFLVRMNAAVDDAARISSYLAAEKRLAKKGAVDIASIRGAERLAERAGGKAPNPVELGPVEAENLMRDWSYNWDSMTPWERSTARFIFPFYGFFSHILRYAGRYAVDHPFRVAVMASFARSELEDWGTGLPERIHNMLMVGKRDEEGNQLALNFGGWSPFADTANLFSLTGWMSQVNPLISTLAEQFGIDPRTGESGIYPATAFDPVSGRLTIAPPNIAQSLLQNVIPQTQVLTSLAGNDQLRRTNPDAAGRQMLSALGIPLLYRNVNVPQEIAQTELARENAARQSLSEALRSGSTGPVRTYPRLAAQVQQLQEAQAQNPAAFAQYTQSAQPAGYLDLVQRTLIPGGVGG